MVNYVNDGYWHVAECEKCGKRFEGFYGVSYIIDAFATDHERICEGT